MTMFFIILLLMLVCLYWYGVRTFDYWKKRGVTHDKPWPYLGNNGRQYTQKMSIAMTATDIYNRYQNEKVVGFYRSTDAELVIRDPEIAKRILITDFHHFYGRGLIHKKNIEPMLKNLFFVEGELWRFLRKKFTPAFTTGKLKAMFPYITNEARKLQKQAKQFSDRGKVCDVRELMARYTTDIIGASGFGINMDTLSEQNSEFRKLGKRIFHRSRKDALFKALKHMFPKLCENLTYLSPEVERSMVHIVKTVMEERNHKPSGKNDFIDLMLELKQNGKIDGESVEINISNRPQIDYYFQLNDMLIIAQVFLFFGAGFETSSSASSFTLHQLAYHLPYQQKVQKEIDRVLEEYNNEITYDSVKKMTCLENALKESLRMYPPVGYLMRECISPQYTIPEVNITINKGVKVLIPIQAYHNDEKYFESPEEFIPERFLDKNVMRNNAYLPFGDGPRACVGARLGFMQSMAGLAAILHKFTVEPAANSLKHPQPDPTVTVSESFIGGLPLLLKKRVL